MKSTRLSRERNPSHSLRSAAVRKYASGEFAQFSSSGPVGVEPSEARGRTERRTARTTFESFTSAILASDRRPSRPTRHERKRAPANAGAPEIPRKKLEPDERSQPIVARRLEGVARSRETERRPGDQRQPRIVDYRLLVGEVEDLSLHPNLERPPRLEHALEREVELVSAGEPVRAARRAEVSKGVA